MFARSMLCLFVAVLVAGCSVRASKGGTAPGAATGFLGMKKGAIDIQDAKALKGVDRVVISSFNVGFAHANKASAKAGGLSAGGRSTAKLELTGIDDAVRQQIVDAAYADFVAQLTANGYTVVDRAELLTHETFAKAKSYPTPYATDNAMVAPGNDLVYLTPTSFGNTIYFGLGDISGMIGGWGKSNPATAAALYADSTKVRVLSVNYVVNYANADGQGGRFSSTSSVTVGQGISVPPGSGIMVVGGQGGTFSHTTTGVRLGQPVFSTDEFAEVVNTTSGAYKGVETTVNLASAVLGGGTNISRSFEVKADPVKYQSISTRVLAEANQKLVAAMAAGR